MQITFILILEAQISIYSNFQAIISFGVIITTISRNNNFDVLRVWGDLYEEPLQSSISGLTNLSDEIFLNIKYFCSVFSVIKCKR